jgi:hypothetical protein
MQRKLLGIISVDFDAAVPTTDHIFYICQILEKKLEYNEAVHQLFIGFKKAYYSVRREVLHNILTEFGVPKKLVRLIKVCLT